MMAVLIATIIILILIFLFFRFYHDKGAVLKRGGVAGGKNTFAGLLREGKRGEPHVCPLCAVLFEHGETVKSKIFPSTGKQDRLMNILGCPYCLNGERIRKCPVCGAEVGVDEYLSARAFHRPDKMHVHVLGCNHCCLNIK